MTKTLAFVLTASLAACAKQPDVRYGGNEPPPAMVAMDRDPSVRVIANSDEPIFYSDNTYWLYRDRQWYRSTSHRGGWARVDQPPERLRRIDRPTDYVRYHQATRTARSPYEARERRVPPTEADPRWRPSSPDEELQPAPDRPPPPDHEPNPQDPARPHANPPPPQQVPPVNPAQLDRPDHQVAPDPGPPATPRPDQRPARDPDDRARDQDQREATPPDEDN